MTDWGLRVISYAGIVAGATHYQGALRRDDAEPVDEIELERPVTAREINGDARGDWHGYHEGDMTTRFESREAVLAAAREQFDRRAAPGDRLLLGAPYLVDRDVLATA